MRVSCRCPYLVVKRIAAVDRDWCCLTVTMPYLIPHGRPKRRTSDEMFVEEKISTTRCLQGGIDPDLSVAKANSVVALTKVQQHSRLVKQGWKIGSKSKILGLDGKRTNPCDYVTRHATRLEFSFKDRGRPLAESHSFVGVKALKVAYRSPF